MNVSCCRPPLAGWAMGRKELCRSGSGVAGWAAEPVRANRRGAASHAGRVTAERAADCGRHARGGRAQDGGWLPSGRLIRCCGNFHGRSAAKAGS